MAAARAVSWLFTFRGRVGRNQYWLAGVLLFAIKLGLDALLVQQLLGRPWTPLFYVSPLQWTGAYPVQDRWHYAVFTLWALPFLWMGTALTVRRLRDAGLSTMWVALFVLPIVNVVFFLLLACMPGGQDRIAAALAEERGRTPDPVPNPTARACLIVVAAAAFTGAVAWLTTDLFAAYAQSVFLGLPFLHGFFVATLLCAGAPRTLPACLIGAVTSLALASLLLLLLGTEGLACIVMAWALAIVPLLLGAFLGWCIVNPRWQTPWVAAGVLMLALPALALGERAALPSPKAFAVTTSVVVHAPAEAVWRNVVAFPPLPEPVEWPFRIGIAYPIGASIDGAGAGALRKCTFNTGSFVEPITTWDPPRLLAFSVLESPQPMIEWNPFHAHVDAKHLHGFFRAQQGEFRLVPLPDGSTRLEGTTWYAHGLWPEPYWRLWGDLLVHAIHRRVLEHVKALSEGQR